MLDSMITTNKDLANRTLGAALDVARDVGISLERVWNDTVPGDRVEFYTWLAVREASHAANYADMLAGRTGRDGSPDPALDYRVTVSFAAQCAASAAQAARALTAVAGGEVPGGELRGAAGAASAAQAAGALAAVATMLESAFGRCDRASGDARKASDLAALAQAVSKSALAGVRDGER